MAHVEFIEIELVQSPLNPDNHLDDLARIIASVVKKALENNSLIVVDGQIQINREVTDGIQLSELPTVARVPSVGVSAR